MKTNKSSIVVVLLVGAILAVQLIPIDYERQFSKANPCIINSHKHQEVFVNAPKPEIKHLK